LTTSIRWLERRGVAVLRQLSFNASGGGHVLDGYEGFRAHDLYQHPKFRRMFTGGPRIVALDAYIPSIGCRRYRSAGHPALTRGIICGGLREYGDPSMASWRTS